MTAANNLIDKHLLLIELLMQSRIEAVYGFSTEVQAAYLEVVNLIWAHQHRHGQTLSPFKLPETSRSGGALQRRQEAISLTFLITQKQDGQITSLRSLLLNGITGADTTVAVLETVPTLWKSETTSNDDLVGLSEIYIDLCHQSSCKEVQAQAMLNLADTLDRLLSNNATGDLSSKLLELWVALPLKSMNPAFANAVARASGSIMATLLRGNKLGGDGLLGWGTMMAEAGRDDKVRALYHVVDLVDLRLTI